ncbi:hypothetical protein [Pectinatus frisingensis]
MEMRKMIYTTNQIENFNRRSTCTMGKISLFRSVMAE